MHLSPPDPQGWLAAHDPLTITVWHDPVVEALGYPPRSPYVETYWLPILGPTALWTLRRLAAWLEAEPDETIVDLGTLASELGLSVGLNRNSPVIRTIARLVKFDMAAIQGDAMAVRCAIPPLARRQLLRLPEHLVASHHSDEGRSPQLTSVEGGTTSVVPFPA